MSDKVENETERGELPFRCEWEIGVQERDDGDEWDHFHPLAKTRREANRLALEDARGDGFEDPVVYDCTGPFKPDNPIRVGQEMIEEVFN